MGYASNAGTFLVETLGGIVLLVFMLRLLMQLVRADFHNPVSQFVVKVTNPVLIPLRRYVPGIAGIDMSSVLVLFVVQYALLFFILMLGGASFFPVGMLVITFAKLIGLVITIFTFSILIQVILSWVNPSSYNPATTLLYSLNEPILSRARSIIPAFQGFDLSPIVAMIGLQLLKMLLVAPINDFGFSLQ